VSRRASDTHLLQRRTQVCQFATSTFLAGLFANGPRKQASSSHAPKLHWQRAVCDSLRALSTGPLTRCANGQIGPLDKVRPIESALQLFSFGPHSFRSFEGENVLIQAAKRSRHLIKWPAEFPLGPSADVCVPAASRRR